MMSLLRLVRRAFTLLRQDGRVVALLVLVNAALALAQFVEPVLFGRIVDGLTRAEAAGREAAWSGVVGLAAAWAAAGLLVIGCSVVVALHADRLAQRNRLAVMATFFEHALTLPQGFHLGTHSARLMKVMTDGTTGLVVLWLPFFRDHCTALMMLGVTLPLSLALNWRLGAVMMGMVALFGLVTLFVLRRTQDMQRAVERYSSDVIERTADVFANLPMIQSFARVGEEAEAVRRLIEALLRAQMPVLSWWALASVAMRASSTLTMVVIFALGLWLKSRGLASIGEIVAFMSLATMLTGRLNQAVTFVHQISLEAPKLQEMFAVLDQRATLDDAQADQDPGRLHGHVAFDGASFSYDGARDAVSDLSFKASPGEIVALVGATGSGKTTTLSLLHRAFDPSRGRITVDGIDLRDMPLQALRRNIGVVFQEPMLLSRSVADNLKVGKSDATVEELDRALAQAQANGFVAAQPQGKATVLGQGGRTLSGGERQRLSIARALVKNPPILIFDEATSALDPATEREVQAALTAVAAERTIFVIAHRLSTIRNADRILVFDRGRVVESGTYRELVDRGAFFARLVNG